MRFGSRRTLVLLLAASAYAPLGLAVDRPGPAPVAAPASAGPETPAYELKCGETLTIWRKARDPGARACCALVVVARAALWTAPARTRDLGTRATALCPTGLEAAMLSATALLALGDAALAHQAFERALMGKGAAGFIRLPAGERLFAARAASLAGKRSRALEHYRSVILDLEQVQSPHERARVLLEAAMVAARTTPPEHAEAHAYLRQSSEHLAPRLHAVRRLVARAVDFGGADADRSADGRGLLAWQGDAADVVAWMQGGERVAWGAPGGVLPVVEPDLLLELMPRELLPAELLEHRASSPEAMAGELEALP
jgi:hypothetical protein